MQHLRAQVAGLHAEAAAMTSCLQNLAGFQQRAAALLAARGGLQSGGAPVAAEHQDGEFQIRHPSAGGVDSGVNLEVLTEQLEQVCSQAQVGFTQLPRMAANCCSGMSGRGTAAGWHENSGLPHGNYRVMAVNLTLVVLIYTAWRFVC